MPRSLWNGTISVGPINVPVKLYPAVESKTVHFREVHLADEAKVEHRRFCSAEDEEVPSDEVVKGFDVGDGKYVVLDKDEIAAAAGDPAHVIDVERFVEYAAIDPVFYEKTYYLGAGKKGEDAYRLLYDALGQTGRPATRSSTTRPAERRATRRCGWRASWSSRCTRTSTRPSARTSTATRCST